MNNEPRRMSGDYEIVTEHERRRRLRSERMRQWRKEARHPRLTDLDDAAQSPLPRRFAP